MSGLVNTTASSPTRLDSPALDRLRRLERSPVAPPRTPKPMGYQPGLDGLRAISVVAVILYHAGFDWMHGGFYGVEVFFVVSGFLITSLLIDERAASGTVALRQFWLRRARRLLPALFAMLAFVALWGALFGSAEQQTQLRRDFPWAIFYVGNWGQVLGKVAYYAPSDPPLLRHLWSLAVEEQWYIVWPLVFVAMAATRWRTVTRAAVLGGVFVAIWAWMWWMTRGGLAEPVSFAGSDVDRTNLLYLSTLTRAGGLVLGAAAAYVWRPWRYAGAARPLPPLEAAGAAAVTSLVLAFGVAELAVPYTFQWLLPMVSILSLVAIAVVVHPGAPTMRAIFGQRWLVAVGQRSYGLYLWHWPIFVFLDARGGSAPRFVVAMAVTAAVSEACYRFVETPIRRGALTRWWAAWRVARGVDRQRRSTRFAAWAGGSAVVLVGLTAFYAQVDRFDRAAGGEDVEFSAPIPTPTQTTTAAPGTTAQPGAVEPDPASSTTSSSVAAPAAPVTAPVLPRKLVIVGDSQAHSLAINLPNGIESTFTVTDGSVEGCGVLDQGRVRSSRASFNRSFADCAGWASKWADAARRGDADVALVVIGAWDVFDVELDSGVVTFGTPQADELFLANLQKGIDALAAAGTHVALLEIPCMRPQDVKGAGVPALPERGDDARVAHLNDLLRDAAAANVATTTFVAGPAAWCGDESIATDLGYRWDGVHVYKPGANLIYETIAPSLLAIPVS